MSGKGADNGRFATVYQIYPRSFMDSDGDGVGDLAGATRRLSHVASLGADMVWLSPFYPSPMLDFGYDVSDYCGVDPLFGSLSDFDRLVAEARRLGLGVMIDLVLSHTSSAHPWFLESRQGADGEKADWYVWADARPDGTPPNNWLSLFGGGAWEWDGGRRQYYFHNFLPEQPDLNFHNPAVRTALLAAAGFWLERGVSGFRLDTVNFYYHDAALRDNPPAGDDADPHIPAANPYRMQKHLHDKTRPETPSFLEELRALCDKASAVLMGEVGAEEGLRVVAEYTAGGRLHTAYSFDFLDGPLSAEHFRKCLGQMDKAARPCWAFSNHDVSRHVSRWRRADASRADDIGLAKLCAALLLSMRGAACIYQGEELALTEANIAHEDIQDPYGRRFWPGFKGRDGCRTPMVWGGGRHGGFSDAEKTWLPTPPEHVAAARENFEGGDDTVLNFYRRMLAFRRTCPPLASGDMRVVDDGHPQTLAFFRENGGEEILAVFNLSREKTVWSMPEGMARWEAAADAPQCSSAVEQAADGVRLPPLGFVFLRARR